ncbi:hypothetical protein ENSA5_27510 [Enhygromyxa salina]|uniref:Uncharacterized protein n=1 Tax=Enhygromyxa salina TaxID=215803 RepID=A0A2S9Y7J2_9BACT|nr:hypothetical protein [Enhygromyxa salina]PRQ01069.1 hypothetical protein ENSA5_27510 [Enhygromyxa salina]
MPGKLHQGTLELFRDDPWLAFDLLGLERPVTGTPIDRRAEVERDAPGRPGQVESNYPDLVLVYEDPRRPGVGIAICVEAQGDLDHGKRWTLPYYQAAVAKDHQLQTWVVVVSYSARLSAALAAWKVGPPPMVDVLVLDVNTVPRVVDLDQARRRPTAAVLAAALHGCQGDVEAARVGIRATLELPKDKRDSYTATILAALPEAHKEIVMGELSVEEQEEIWAIERRSGTFLLGRQEGRQEGRRTTLVELILAVLEVRNVPLAPDDEVRIRGCEDLATLERWARLAREVERASALFTDG